MDVYPLMDIRFPENKENEFLAAMRSEADPPWRWQASHPQNRALEGGSFYFHRDAGDELPACIVCIHRERPGHFVVTNIVPDARRRIPHDEYVALLRDFDSNIAGPAAEALDGMTSVGTATHRLEDYFSPEAIRLLERFCKTSNAADRGSHPSDQEKWIEFLLFVHREKAGVHCDIFGACLRAKNWWPDDAIPELVHEFDFGMRLLTKRDEQSAD